MWSFHLTSLDGCSGILVEALHLGGFFKLRQFHDECVWDGSILSWEHNVPEVWEKAIPANRYTVNSREENTVSMLV